MKSLHQFISERFISKNLDLKDKYHFFDAHINEDIILSYLDEDNPPEEKDNVYFLQLDCHDKWYHYNISPKCLNLYMDLENIKVHA